MIEVMLNISEDLQAAFEANSIAEHDLNRLPDPLKSAMLAWAESASDPDARHKRIEEVVNLIIKHKQKYFIEI